MIPLVPWTAFPLPTGRDGRRTDRTCESVAELFEGDLSIVGAVLRAAAADVPRRRAMRRFGIIS